MSSKMAGHQLDNENIHDMPLETLLAIQEKVGTKAFSKTISSYKKTSSNVNRNNGFKRANKNRPREVPMIRDPAPRILNIGIKNTKPRELVNRDPRFDDLSGKLDIFAWKKNYHFLKDKREEEKNILMKAMKNTKNLEKSKTIKNAISRMEDQERESKKIGKQLELKKILREKAISSLKAGKAPKFISKKQRQLTLKTEHFDTLKKENRLDKYLIRKEKKLRAKEFKKL